MVSFENIKLHQRVEVRYRGRILKGTVKFKGNVNGNLGDWVGIALDHAVGEHDGMIDGRRYFSCGPKHGIFSPAHEIRFVRLKRQLYNSYRTVRNPEQIENELFNSEVPEVNNGPYDPIATSRSYSSLSSDDDIWTAQPRQHTLRHSVGGRLPSAIWKRPETARARYNYYSQPIHVEYENDHDDFISSPSIPMPHMPYQALKQQCRRGWDEPHTHLVREWSVHTGRDSVVYSSWNDF